jgi:hypothetical protein
MRRTPVVAAAALIAVAAVAGLPAPAGSSTSTSHRAVETAAFTTLTIPATTAPAAMAPGELDPALRSDGHLGADAVFVEPGTAPRITARRARVDQPASPVDEVWKPPRYTLSGYATFYDHGTTAMRLPRGTVVRICGEGGCIERTVTDYGPTNTSRIVDLYRPDFFAVCGCASFAGTTWVTVSVY